MAVWLESSEKKGWLPDNFGQDGSQDNNTSIKETLFLKKEKEKGIKMYSLSNHLTDKILLPHPHYSPSPINKHIFVKLLS